MKKTNKKNWGDAVTVANSLGCSPEYARQVLNGRRNSKSVKAQAIKKAFELLKETESAFNKKAQVIISELEGE